jgi:6-pyruvoyltetrahydropterin/6-carboxytetrahydropterin synthase
MKVELRKSFTFEAAHSHPGEGEPACRVHGHSFFVDAWIGGEVCPERGWLTDFAEIKKAIKPVIDALDHRYLNDLEGLHDPRVEHLAAWIESRVTKILPYQVRIGVVCREVSTPRIDRDGEKWVLRFEAAHFLPKTPEGHKCRRLHGHSYRLEIETLDSEKAPGALEALFQEVDHRNLNDLAWLPNPTAELMCREFWNRLVEAGVQPKTLSLSETCESGCLYRGQ